MSTSMFPCNFDVPCDGYACTNRAKWFIGEQRNHYIIAKLCEDCIRSIFPNLEEEFNLVEDDPIIIKKGRGSHTCEVCGESFTTRHKLWKHRLEEHAND